MIDVEARGTLELMHRSHKGNWKDGWLVVATMQLGARGFQRFLEDSAGSSLVGRFRGRLSGIRHGRVTAQVTR